ncbi:3-hydroxyacyl-CoA dehydrogenase [Dongia rigui]|uniref:3-hydroxyacyl-CoA dehydrogenase n=1 Tax=Dongia rigui TaxID=940149 RepID=A0ABU5E3Q6_9PROT|nr:3-hydroxyacyl-CoA dehydrogenase [Dongia rigui]MDY0873829.1 3-hydroxyacyl-CoA dehydrogenase [Dongia rigui]
MAVIAIIGAGLIGRAWAITFARAGHEVRIYDAFAGAADKAKAFAIEALSPLAVEDLLDGQSVEEVAVRLKSVPTLAAALAGAAYVQENTPEDLASKKLVFAQLDAAAAPDTILASSTSALLPSHFTADLVGRARCLVVHPINPPYLIPAAEIVPAPWTAPEVIDHTRRLLAAVGQSPIVMKREIDGFVMNRLQGALLEEAFRLVADGYASVEDVDIGIREGLALRWSFMGPFETIDLNAPGGVRDYVARYQKIYERLFPSMQRRIDWAGPVLGAVEDERRARLPEAGLQKRQAWRDRRLMALAAHKRKAAGEIGS